MYPGDAEKQKKNSRTRTSLGIITFAVREANVSRHNSN